MDTIVHVRYRMRTPLYLFFMKDQSDGTPPGQLEEFIKDNKKSLILIKIN